MLTRLRQQHQQRRCGGALSNECSQMTAARWLNESEWTRDNHLVQRHRRKKTKRVRCRWRPCVCTEMHTWRMRNRKSLSESTIMYVLHYEYKPNCRSCFHRNRLLRTYYPFLTYAPEFQNAETFQHLCVIISGGSMNLPWTLNPIPSCKSRSL